MRIALLHADLIQGAQLTFPALVEGAPFDLGAFHLPFGSPQPFRDSWTPPLVLPLETDPQAPLLDLSALGFVPVFSAQAVRSLQVQLEASGELLPLRLPSGSLRFAFHSLRHIPALDYANSDLQWLPAAFSRTGAPFLQHVRRWSFFDAALAGAFLFKIPEFPLTHLFATEAFVDAVVASGLTGFRFELLSPQADLRALERAAALRRRQKRRGNGDFA